MRGWYSLKTQTYEAGLVTLVSAALIDPEGGDCSFPEPLPLILSDAETTLLSNHHSPVIFESAASQRTCI
jgi:hypothetical protein